MKKSGLPDNRSLQGSPRAREAPGRTGYGLTRSKEQASELRACGSRRPLLQRIVGELVGGTLHARPRRRPGHRTARGVLGIAAAGGHHLLLVGPPRAAKTPLARRLPGILPPPTAEEAMASTAVHSVAGLLDPADGLLAERPFRAPHFSASVAALIGGGGGHAPRPGEVSPAHHGVLFLDDVVELARPTLEALRGPLDDGSPGFRGRYARSSSRRASC